MKISGKSTTGELVTKNPIFASVFNKYEIDFCCNGSTTLQAACDKLKLDVQLIIDDLLKLSGEQVKGKMDFDDWPLDLLCDYIEKTHHSFVKEQSEEIVKYLDKVCQVHGKKVPGITEVKTLFKEGSVTLGAHMEEEESVLFPYIRQMVDAQMGKEQLMQKGYRTVKDVVERMEMEHKEEGERFKMVEKLIKSFAPETDLCNTFLVSINMLKEFDENLKTHIHLENNILFPKAIVLEKKIESIVN